MPYANVRFSNRSLLKTNKVIRSCLSGSELQNRTERLQSSSPNRLLQQCKVGSMLKEIRWMTESDSSTFGHPFFLPNRKNERSRARIYFRVLRLLCSFYPTYRHHLRYVRRLPGLPEEVRRQRSVLMWVQKPQVRMVLVGLYEEIRQTTNSAQHGGCRVHWFLWVNQGSPTLRWNRCRSHWSQGERLQSTLRERATTCSGTAPLEAV